MHESTQDVDSIPTGQRWILGIAAAILFAVGVPIFVDPMGYQSGMGVALPESATLLSDMRAQAGALVGVGILLFAGALFRPRIANTAAVAGAILYLSYALSRLISIGLDGPPAAALIGAAGLELVMGLLLSAVAVRRAKR